MDRIAQARSEFLADLRATFGSAAGQRVLTALGQSVGIGRPVFLPAAGGGPCDPYAAASRDGRRSVIEEIHANLAVPEDRGESKPGVIGGPGGPGGPGGAA